MKHVLFFFFLVLATGIALGRTEFLAFVHPAAAGAVTAGLLVLAWLTAGRHRFPSAALLLSCMTLGLFIGLASPHPILEKKWEAALGGVSGRTVTLEGTMSEGRRVQTDAYGRERYAFFIDDLSGAIPGGVRVAGILKPGMTLPKYGERVRVTGGLSVPAGRTNPAGFDWRRFLMTRGAYAVMRADAFEVTGPPRGWRGAALALREKWIRCMDAGLSPDASDISKAIYLGERSELDPDFRRSLVNTGTLHLFAISGFNVGFVAVILFGLFTLLRIPKLPKSLLVMALLAGYAVLVGDNSPVVRAVIMAGFLMSADLLRTRASALQGLGAAGVLMLVMNPEEAFDPAFQLSFAAVAGLALVVPLWGTLDDIRRARSDRRSAQWRAAVTLTALTSLAAWVTTAPILIHHFNRFSFVAPAVNILLVPVALVLNFLLMVFSVVALAWPEAARLLGFSIEWNVWLLKWLVGAFDRLPGASWNLASWNPVVWALFGAWWVWMARNRKNVRRPLRVALSIAVMFVLIGADGARAAAVLPALRVTHFDAGQANAALVEIGNSRILIDAGRGGDADAAGRILIPYLASIGASSLDAVIVTHPQFDHAGGLERLLREVRIGSVWTNGDVSEARFFQQTLKAAAEKSVPVRTLKRGDRIAGLPAGARVRILHPAPYFAGGGDVNERSLVILVEASGKKLLWTGDIGEKGLSDLLMNRRIRDIDVLQVPHHGARTGMNGRELLDQARPAVAVISCGRENRYGHPHPTTLEALDRTAARVHRTDREGALQITLA